MLMDYKGSVTVKIDGIAASAASVIAMAGTKVYVSPVSMIMIHNPMTIAAGDKGEMEKAIAMLESVKDSIINAYEIKTGLSRAKISHLMDAETWMDANAAIEMGFADEILSRAPAAAKPEPEDEPEEDGDDESADGAKKKSEAMLFSRRAVSMALVNKLQNHIRKEEPKPTGRSVDELRVRLNDYKKFI